MSPIWGGGKNYISGVSGLGKWCGGRLEMSASRGNASPHGLNGLSAGFLGFRWKPEMVCACGMTWFEGAAVMLLRVRLVLVKMLGQVTFW
jgi:hypothetical protein